MGDNICLSNIITTIIKLKDKISKYHDLFSRSEMLTRYALVDPFLRSLGWNTENPEIVIPEYSTTAGVPDYALLIENKLVALIEAKALGNKWDPMKLVSYANTKGVPFVIATDGNVWEVYEVFKPVEFEKKLVVSWMITKDNPAIVALKALSIANFGKIETFGELATEPILKAKMEIRRPQEQRKLIRGPMDSNLARKLIIKVLSRTKRPLSVQQILKEIEKIFEPTDYDLELLSGKEKRWKNRVRWQLSKLKNEGVIKRIGVGIYVIK